MNWLACLWLEATETRLQTLHLVQWWLYRIVWLISTENLGNGRLWMNCLWIKEKCACTKTWASVCMETLWYSCTLAFFLWRSWMKTYWYIRSGCTGHSYTDLSDTHSFNCFRERDTYKAVKHYLNLAVHFHCLDMLVKNVSPEPLILFLNK